MNTAAITSRLSTLLSFSFVIFAIACTFSIALAQTALGFAAIFFICLSFVNPKDTFKNSPKDVYLILIIFICWSAITSCIGAGGFSGLIAIKKYWLMLILPLGLYLFRSKEYRNQLLLILSIVVLIGGLAGLLQFFTGITWPGVKPPIPSNSWGYRAQGLFSSRMTFALVFTPLALMYIFLGLSILKKSIQSPTGRLYLASGIIGSISVILSLSRASMLALVIGLIVIGIILGRKQLAFIIAILVIVVTLSWNYLPDFALKIQNTTLIDMKSNKVAGRLFIWEKTFKIISDNLVLGVGQSQFQTEYKKLLDKDFKDKRIPGDAHNDWFHMTASAGIPGLILFVGLWFTILRRAFRYVHRSNKERIIPLSGLIGLLAVLVMSTGVSLFEDSEMIQIILLIWVIIIGQPDDMQTIENQKYGTAQ